MQNVQFLGKIRTYSIKQERITHSTFYKAEGLKPGGGSVPRHILRRRYGEFRYRSKIRLPYRIIL